MEKHVLFADDLQQKFVFLFKRQVEGALLNLRGVQSHESTRQEIVWDTFPGVNEQSTVSTVG
jgi:hypothetical protein